MKKYQIILCSIILSFKALAALSLADLDVDPRVKQQIADSFALQESIQQFLADNTERTVVTVGGDNACDYRIGSNRIQNAINENTNVEIRIATNDSYNENLVIDDNSVSLKGGYANCTDAANDILDPQVIASRISGVTGAEQPVIRILGNTQRNTITLERLRISGGEGTSENFSGGGISIYQADAQIAIADSYVSYNNSSRNGGGLAIIGGDTDIIATDFAIRSNTAQAGGGFFCNSSAASLVMHWRDDINMNRIAFNKANSPTVYGGGGGVYLTSGCSFMMYSGGSLGIYNNLAVHSGGGVKVTTDSIVTLFGHEVCTLSGACLGTNTSPVRLWLNFSHGSSGGAYITGINTMLNIYAGFVTNNRALNGMGGAINIIDGATFTTGRLSKACWSKKNCNYYGFNAAQSSSSFGNGGAIRCYSSAMSITNTVFAYNRADRGTAIAMDFCNSSIKGSLMYQNGNSGNVLGEWEDNYVVATSGSNGTLDIRHTTITDNESNLAVLHNDGSDVKIVASIIHDASTGPVLSSNSTEVKVECSMLHEDASLTTLPTLSIVDDPEFIDRDNRDYRLNAQTSPAVDYCYATNTGIYTDIDFESDWDDPMVTNLHGHFDIGADETYGNDIIFANNFE